ncbi:hypothetical protein BKA62DRAFT_755124 [Auriculariales sp. MPI-PUGE-AT-0066]|nr:hypothetical protein BKA62DRAFT_755124 [Auriculariales sp. MPI-PUGE-AT-0066]
MSPTSTGLVGSYASKSTCIYSRQTPNNQSEATKRIGSGCCTSYGKSSFFSIDIGNGRQTVERQQPHVTGAYAFTNYRSQGQTLAPVIVDLATPATGGELSPFNAYVACSRAKGRDTIRFLRLPADKLLRTHPPKKECKAKPNLGQRTSVAQVSATLGIGKDDNTKGMLAQQPPGPTGAYDVEREG